MPIPNSEVGEMASAGSGARTANVVFTRVAPAPTVRL